jgi:molybdate-binding protein
VAWRPPGAGSRLLLERLMRQAGLQPRPELGVRAESHLAVATAVAAGAADTGLAVRAVADSLGLDWIPVATEWFELALAAGSRSAMDPLLDVLGSTMVQNRLAALPGYELAMSGEVRGVA